VTSDCFTVLIAGGGVAALEAALTLRDVGEGKVAVELLAAEPSFWYRPVAVAEPFGLGEVRHFDLGDIADEIGVSLTLGALAAVDVDRREATTAAGLRLRYDALLVALGAVPQVAVAGADTFRGPADAERMRDVLGALERREATQVAFAVPWGAAWALPIYELALMTAAFLRSRDVNGVELSLVTPEPEPLELFGRPASAAVRELLDDADIQFVGGVSPLAAEADGLRLVSGDLIPADRVVALPRLRGQRIDGLPQTVEGFVPIDDHCAVVGTDVVFAAGDVTSFPIKQGGIAAQQAVAAAEAIAVLAGATLVPHPFRPVLRGLLLTGAEPRYLRRDLSGGDDPDWASSAPIWWPPTKIVGRRLAPFLASRVEGAAAPEDRPPAPGIAVERRLAGIDVVRPLPAPPAPRTAADRHEVGIVMRPAPITVSSATGLDAVVRMMRGHERGSVVVVDDDRLIGILTARDVLRAVASAVDPAAASAGQWMTAEPVTVTPSTTLAVAETLMCEYGIHHLPVVDGGRVVGMVGLRDVTRAQRHGETVSVGLGF
jgi:sulfide:quinone oxidoreductase